MDLSPPTGDQALQWAHSLFDRWTELGDSAQLIGVFAVLGLAFGVSWLRGRESSSAKENAEMRAAYQQRVRLPQTGNRSFIGKTVHRWVEPVTLAGVKIETKDKHIAIGATTGARKALALDTLVPTPSGWTTMGELEPGDFVFDERGVPTYVLDVSPVSTGNPCFEVEFSDGSTVVADAEHLWLTETRANRLSEIQQRKSGPFGSQTLARQARSGKAYNPLLAYDQTAKRTFASLVTTAEMATTLKNGPHVNHSVKLAGALNLPESVLPVPPYVLGAWLGDGHSAAARLTCHASDVAIIDEIRKEGVSAEQHPTGHDNDVHLYHLGVAGQRARCTGLSLQSKLRVLGVLGHKHIPLDYLRASEAQRLALLQGLMDTDGWAPTRGGTLFCSTSRELAYDVFGLVASLGMRPHMTLRDCLGATPESSVAYTLQFTANRPVFRLERKANRLSTSHRATQDKRYVIAVRPVDSVPVRCIRVGSESGLFLVTRSYIPTHNTTLIANLIMQAKRPCVVIAGDNSPYAKEAMLARGWRVWSADGKNGGLYVHEGTPNEAAQIVTVLLNPRRTAGDTGLQRGMARGVFRAAYVAMDEAGIPRSWPALRRALLDAEPPEGIPNRNFDSARANWLARIDELMEALGLALGHDVSVLDCVRSECGLFFDLNAFSDLDMATSFGEAAVRLTQHAADKTGDFWWICDELALFDAELLGQIVRTCRIRRVKFVGASQIISDFGKTLRGLVKCWFVGEQTAADHESRKWCSDLTMGHVPPENFAEHATQPGFYYVVSDGRTQELQLKPWHHPKPIAPLTLYSQRPIPSLEDETESPPAPVAFEVDSVIDSVEADGRWKPAPVVEGPPVMPRHWKGDAQLENIWLHHTFPGGADGCHASTYRLNNRGRPMCSYQGVDWMAYMLSLALADGLNLGEVKMRSAAGELTVDHLCQNIRCTKAEHLTWESRSRNSELLHERRRLRVLRPEAEEELVGAR